MAARQRLTVFLLEDVQELEDALDDERSPELVLLDPALGLDGAFYWESRPPSPPPWVGYVTPALTALPASLRTSSASGLLVLRVAGRLFAITFGYARGFLDQSKIVRQFGLKVALNTIDPEHLRSLDTKTFESMVVAKNTQASRSTDLSAFGVDVARDILRAVTGRPRNERFGRTIAGSDAVVLNVHGSVGDLPGLCVDLLASYQADTYKGRFGWVDDLSIVQDRDRVAELDERVVAELRARDTSTTHLATPDPLDWAEVEAFAIAGTGNLEYEDLDLDLYLANIDEPDLAVLTPALLRSRRIKVRYARSSNWAILWSLHQALVSEQELDGNLYVLIEGRWFEVSGSLSSRVDEFVDRLATSPIDLPAARPGETEPEYNKRVAAVDAEHRLCLDAKILRPGGASSGIEFCDVLTSDGVMLHMKRKSRSSTLSHLFAQGVVAATALLADSDFRLRLREEITRAVGDAPGWEAVIPGPSETPVRSSFTVSFVVVANSARARNGWLPFFSRLNLMQQARSLDNLGLRYTLDRVDVG